MKKIYKFSVFLFFIIILISCVNRSNTLPRNLTDSCNAAANLKVDIKTGLRSFYEKSRCYSYFSIPVEHDDNFRSKFISKYKK
jgi:hypothetical protein